MGKTEFYDGKNRLTEVDVLVPLQKDQLISIAKKTYRVVGVTWAIDYSDSPLRERVARCNVDLKELAP